MKINKIFYIISLFLFSSFIYTQSNNDEILSKILKELQELKSGQEKLANEVKKIKSAPADKPKPALTAAQSAKVKNIPIGDSIVLGNPDAPVTIVKWTDFQWPYCAKSVGLIDDVLEKHPNDVKVVVKNFPLSFHKQARDAAKYALASDRQKVCGPSKNESCYKDMYHMIMENFRKLKANPELPVEYAEQLGLNMVKFKQDAKDPAFESLIKKESLELSQNFERKSVPKFLVAGREPASRDLKTFSDMITAKLTELKK